MLIADDQVCIGQVCSSTQQFIIRSTQQFKWYHLDMGGNKRQAKRIEEQFIMEIGNISTAAESRGLRGG